MAGTVVPFHWRTSIDEPPDRWRYGAEEWHDGTIGGLRAHLASSLGRPVALAAAHDPELWQYDEEGAPVRRVELRLDILLCWTPATFPPEWLAVYPTGEPRFFWVFTFPPAEAAAERAGRIEREAKTYSGIDWPNLRARARVFFRRLAGPGTLQTDADGYLYLPEHPSMAMSTRQRFDVVMDSSGQTVVPLLSRSLAHQYEAAMLEQCKACHNFMYIYGAQGVGKSHALYEAVCRLMAQRNKVRVIYMHDCGSWRDDADVAVQQMAAVTAVGFHPDKDAAIWTAAAAVRTYLGLHRLLSIVVPEFCRERGLMIIALFDQHNDLAVNLRKQLPWSVPERVLTTLSSWKNTGATVISESANDDYIDKTIDSCWRRLQCFHGFTDDEVALWRRHHHFFDGPEHVAAWEDVVALIAHWPLDLNDMRRDQRSNLSETLEAHRLKRLRDLYALESEHLRQGITKPFDRSAYPGVIYDMLIGHGAITYRFLNAWRVINKHTLYYQASDDSVRPIHDLARQFYLLRFNSRRPGKLSDAATAILS